MTILWRATIASVAFIAVLGVCLFLGAGRIDIPLFWAWLAVYLALIVFSLRLLDPELLAERMRPAGKRLPLRMHAATLVVFGQFLLAGYDRGRLHLGGGVPVALEILGFILAIAMWLVMLWAMHVNRFFSSIARLQPDRGQVVIAAGPYRLVRHPAYALAMLGCPGNGLALGSWLAAAVGALAVPLLLWRCIGEDRMLRAGLPGYADYAARVRWRLFPGLW